uniref:Uncharacterized protein n=1 Tax=Oryza punctata TaxID=4537 RepID=A0A0E0JQN1_ORYPU
MVTAATEGEESRRGGKERLIVVGPGRHQRLLLLLAVVPTRGGAGGAHVTAGGEEEEKGGVVVVGGWWPRENQFCVLPIKAKAAAPFDGARKGRWAVAWEGGRGVRFLATSVGRGRFWRCQIDRARKEITRNYDNLVPFVSLTFGVCSDAFRL